jgi:hypothetical protein
MTRTRRLTPRLRTSLAVTALACIALWSGCGFDGAGTVHIDSPKARKQTMQTGAGVAPTTTAKPSPSAESQNSVLSSVSKNRVPKNR